MTHSTPARSRSLPLILAGFGLLALFVGLLAWWPDSPTPQVATNAEEPQPDASTMAGQSLAEKEKETRSAVSNPPDAAGTPTPATSTVKGTGSVRVTVLHGPKSEKEDARDKPAAGITVMLRRYQHTTPFQRRKTDAEGRCSFSGLPPGRHLVRVDRQTMVYRWAMIEADKEIEVTVPIQTGIRVQGVVVDDTGTPVERADIVVSGWADQNFATLGQSGPRGRFDVRYIGSLHSVGARRSGYAPSSMHRCATGDQGELKMRIVLPGPGGSLAGQVLDADGKPVDGVPVRYGNHRQGSSITLPDGSDGSSARDAVAHTDHEGRFLLEGLPVGTKALLVRSPHYPGWKRDIEITAQQRQTVLVRLDRGAAVAGIVRDPAGKPVPKLRVYIAKKGDQLVSREAKTDAEGRYKIRGLSPGTMHLSVKAAEKGRAATELVAVAGTTITWDAVLDQGQVLTGTILGKDRQPVTNAHIEAMASLGNGTAPWFTWVETNDSGVFRLLNCPADREVDVTIHASGYRQKKLSFSLADNPIRIQIEWVGKPTGRILGQVIQPDGSAAKSAELTLMCKDGPGGFVYTSKADGSIEIDKQHGGTYQLRVKSTRFPQTRTPWRPLEKGGVLDFGEIQLREGGRVEVTLASDQPIPKKGVYMSLRSASGEYVAAIHKPKSASLSEPVEPGKMVLLLSGPKVIPILQPLEVVAGRTTKVEVPFRVGIERHLEITVERADHKEINLIISGPGLRTPYHRTLRRYRSKPYRLSMGCQPGKYQIVAECAGGTQQFTFTVPDGATHANNTAPIRFTMR